MEWVTTSTKDVKRKVLATICIIDPEYYTATRIDVELFPLELSTEEIIHAFFQQWDKYDKYEKCYALGVENFKEI